MGNLFSPHHIVPPISKPRFRRKPRGFSASSNGSDSLALSNGISISVSCDGNGDSSAAKATNVTNNHGPVSKSASNGSSVSNSKHRRSSLKVALKRAYSNASAQSNVLTVERRQLVQESWKEVTDKTGKLQAALCIFKSLFDACPELKRVFNVDSVSVDPSQTCSHFVRHARVFANVLDLAVRNVLELEVEVGPILVMFGRRHYYKHQLGFRNQYLTLFAQSISDFIVSNLSESFLTNPEVSHSWQLFITYIIHKVKEGYDLECIQTRKHSVSILY